MLRLTPDLLAASYALLRLTMPFSRWGLPPPEKIEFRIRRDHAKIGKHLYRDGAHLITVSSACVGHLPTLVRAMAHEMVHAYQAERGTNGRAVHNAEFRLLASRVCRWHGFDPAEF